MFWVHERKERLMSGKRLSKKNFARGKYKQGLKLTFIGLKVIEFPDKRSSGYYNADKAKYQSFCT